MTLLMTQMQELFATCSDTDSRRSFGHRYGAGSGQIWLYDVQCSGTETTIANYGHNGWGSHNCEHHEDV